MPKYGKVEDSQSLTVKLTRSHYAWVRDNAKDRHIPPGQVIAQLIAQAMAPVAMLPHPAKKVSVQKEPKPQRELDPAIANLAPGPLLLHIEDVFETGITQDRLVRAVELHLGKNYNPSSNGSKGANWRGWRITLHNGKLPKCTAAILEALKDLGHPYELDEQS